LWISPTLSLVYVTNTHTLTIISPPLSLSKAFVDKNVREKVVVLVGKLKDRERKVKVNVINISITYYKL